MRAWRRTRNVVVLLAKAVVACRCQRAAPTLTTVCEIVALAAPLVRIPAAGAEGSVPLPARPLRGAALLALRAVRGWAPAVIVAQGVRLISTLVQQREQQGDKTGREGTEVRALQLGLSVVPRVDPHVPRTLREYASIYAEWLLLLRGRLVQAAVDLPDWLVGDAGDEELMRFALCYNILQARSLRDALVALDRTTANVREFVAWHAKYDFMAPADLCAWQRVSWWEGPDEDGHAWLMIDMRAAVSAARTHGADLVARVLVSNMEFGVRSLLPELHAAQTLRVVVDASGVHINAALRMRGVFQRVGAVMDRMYPCRLQVLYMVGLPLPLRWALRAAMQLLHVQTRRKMRLCRATEVPRRLPSQLRSHRLLGAGWAGSSWGLADGGGGADPDAEPWDGPSAASRAGTVDGSAAESDTGEPFTPHTPSLQRGGTRFRPWRHAAVLRDAATGRALQPRVSGSGSGRRGRGGPPQRRAALWGGTAAVGGGLLVLLLYVALLQALAPAHCRALLVRLARPLLLGLQGLLVADDSMDAAAVADGGVDASAAAQMLHSPPTLTL